MDRDVPIAASTADKYGVDLEEFKMKSGRKPKKWKEAVKIPSGDSRMHMDTLSNPLPVPFFVN